MNEIIKIDWGQVITTIVALIGLFVTINVNARSMKQILDGSSEWRKSLFKACSKKEIDMNDVHLLRTSLRYIKHPSDSEELSFNWFTNESITFCNNLIACDYSKKCFKLSYEDKEIVRLIIRCLLKNHWEYSNRFYAKKDKMNAKTNDIVKDTTLHINEFTNEYFQWKGSKNDKPEDNKDIDSKTLILNKLEGKNIDQKEILNKGRKSWVLILFIVILFLIFIYFIINFLILNFLI